MVRVGVRVRHSAVLGKDDDAACRDQSFGIPFVICCMAVWRRDVFSEHPIVSNERIKSP